MSDLKILKIDRGDSQKTLIDKVNYNFSSIVSFGGGPYGKTGKAGTQGDQGGIGPTGSYGDPGVRGQTWFVGANNPTSPIQGDLWLNTGNYNTVYKYESSSWNLYDLNLRAQDVFRIYTPIVSGFSNSGYFNSSVNPLNYTLVLSDSSFSLAGNSLNAFNPQSSKVVISTNSLIAQRKILEFSKSDSDSLAFSKSPSFYWVVGPTTGKETWETGTPATSGNYGLILNSPEGFLVNSKKSFNINSSSNFYSYSNGISINTSSNSPIVFNSGSYFSLSLSGGVLKLSSSNLYASSSNILNYSGAFLYNNLYDNSRDSKAFRISSSGNTSNLIVNNSLAPSRNSTLLHIRDTYYGNDVLKLYSNGDLYALRKFNAIQNPVWVNNGGTSSVELPGTGGSPSLPKSTVYWLNVVPSVASGGTGPFESCLFCSSGTDFIVDPANYGPNVNLGISLWTPAYSSNSMDSVSNGGWLNLLNDLESITFTVRMKTPGRYFRFVGLNTNTGLTGAPDGAGPTGPADTYGNYQVHMLSATGAPGATNIEFTILNLSNGVARSQTDRWFKVYYSAYGGLSSATGSSEYSVSGVLCKNGTINYI